MCSSIVLEISQGQKNTYYQGRWPEVVLEQCNNSKGAIKKVNCLMKLPKGARMARECWWLLLSISRSWWRRHIKEAQRGMTFLGVIFVFEDPLKALQKKLFNCQKLGVQIKIITRRQQRGSRLCSKKTGLNCQCQPKCAGAKMLWSYEPGRISVTPVRIDVGYFARIFTLDIRTSKLV